MLVGKLYEESTLGSMRSTNCSLSITLGMACCCKMNAATNFNNVALAWTEAMIAGRHTAVVCMYVT